MSRASNRYPQSVLACEPDGMRDVIGLCTSHDESRPPIDHRIPYFANLVIVPITRQNDLTFHLARKILGRLFRYVYHGFFVSILSSNAEPSAPRLGEDASARPVSRVECLFFRFGSLFYTNKLVRR